MREVGKKAPKKEMDNSSFYDVTRLQNCVPFGSCFFATSLPDMMPKGLVGRKKGTAKVVPQDN